MYFDALWQVYLFIVPDFVALTCVYMTLCYCCVSNCCAHEYRAYVLVFVTVWGGGGSLTL